LSAEASGTAKRCSRSSEIAAHDALKSVLTIPRNTHSAALNAMLGFMHCLDARFGWWDDPQTAVGKGRAYIDRALELDPDNADAYLVAGGLFWLERRYLPMQSRDVRC
jgi:hypothetical protein